MNNFIAVEFSKHRILLRNLQILSVGEFSKKRNLKLFFGVDMSRFYTLVFWREAKSKFLLKDMAEYERIAGLCEAKFECKIKKRICFYTGAVCGKVLRTQGWKFYEFDGEKRC